jgi:hypothetical protein
MVKKGGHLTEEHKHNVSVALKGKMPKNINQIKSMHTGVPKSALARARMSASKKKLCGDPAEREKLRQRAMGHHHSDETKKKMSVSRKGHAVTQHTREKIRTALAGTTRPEFCGEKNPTWNGGSSFGKYCPKFTLAFKERVRYFFNNVCVECGESPTYKLHVHHVNYDKAMCCNDTEPLFVALCRSCHAKTTGKRIYWEEHFTDIINKYYGGKCYLSQEEMPAMKNILSISVEG